MRISAWIAAFAMLLTVSSALGRPVLGTEIDQSTAAPAQVFRQWLPAALAGDAAAQYELGRAYADGAVTVEDMAEAARWYKMAADQGSARAQRDLAILYNKGQGVPQDYVQAYAWFDLAAIRFGTGRRHEQAAEMRNMMAAFLTPEQLNEAKRLSAEWQANGE
jgi:hypothetical protein